MYKRCIAILLLSSSTLACSCASLGTKQVEGAFRALQGVAAVGEPLIRQECRARAYKCFKAQDTHCQTLRDCQAVRQKFMEVVIAAHRAIALSRTYLVEGETLMSKRALEQAIALLGQAHNLLKAFGLEV